MSSNSWKATLLVCAVVAAALLTAATTGAATEPRCFGAASMDPAVRCQNPTLARLVVPTPTVARHLPPSPCAPTAHDPGIDVCSFGASQAGAAATIALLGDSHAQHWRP